MKKKIFFLLILLNSSMYGMGILNYQTVLSKEEQNTKELIKNKKEEVLNEIKNYKKSLLKKQKALSNNLYMLQSIEALLKKELYYRSKISKNLNK